MFTTAEKSTSTTLHRNENKVEQTFFKKAGEGQFFGASDSPSFFGSAIQTKLEVSNPDDPQEKEADAMADKVMRMPAPESASVEEKKEDESVQKQEEEKPQEEQVQAKEEEEQEKEEQVQAKLYQQNSFVIHRQQEQESEEEETIQAKHAERVSRKEERESELPPPPSNIQTGGGFTVYTKRIRGPDGVHLKQAGRAPPAQSQHFETQLSSTKGKGSVLPDSTRQFMENRFEADFSQVRVHTGSEAGVLSRSIHAQAFTHGSDIYFNSGKYSPHTSGGSLLLAHELTHTIQQGASPVQRKLLRKPAIQKISSKRLQRSAESQRHAAVERAKAEQGKVSANKQGSDGKREGWQRLMEYFKTTFGSDRILPEGAAPKDGTVNEADIKTKRTFEGNVIDPGDGVTVRHNQPRDAMPSWCGIFAFWALNKGGIPLKKWELGGSMIPPEAAYPPGYLPKAGDIAYLREFSHYALVASSDGSKVTSVNGNTAGDDNVGGEIQLQTHPVDHWFGFFDPTKLMDGVLQDPGSPENEGAAPVRSLSELRKKLFNVQRKEDAQEEQDVSTEKKQEIGLQTKSEQATSQNIESTDALVASSGVQGEKISKQEEKEEQEEDKQVDRKGEFTLQRARSGNPALSFSEPIASRNGNSLEVLHTQSEVAGSDQKEEEKNTLSRKDDRADERAPPRAPPVQHIQPKIQRSWLGDAWDAVSGAASAVAEYIEEGLDAAKEWLLEQVRDFVSEIPGYDILCLILGEDPITGESTPLTGENLLKAGLDVLPGGFMFEKLLKRLGLSKDVALWLEGRIEDFKAVASIIAVRFSVFWRNLSLDDVADPDAVISDVADILEESVNKIVGFIKRSAETFLEMIKEKMISEIAEFVRSKIPKLYPLLTVALGFDPETLEVVERNGTNILNAFLEFSDDGLEQKRQMQETGTFERIAQWVDEGIDVFTTAYSLLKSAFNNIWDFVTVENLFDPVGTFTQIFNQFAAPVIIVGQFVINAGLEILKIIKEALLSALSEHAKGTKGYTLITLIIGSDPFTGEKVPRTVHNVVKAFMCLMDGGEQQYEQLKESGAIDKVVGKVNRAVKRLKITPQYIIGLFTELWKSFTIYDLMVPPLAFMRIVDTFSTPIQRLVRFVIDIIMIVIEAILILMNFPFDLISSIISGAKQAFHSIKRNPVGFLKNLLKAIKQGFVQFFDNIVTHLINGVTGWLMAELREASVPEPQDFTFQGIISWVLEILGLSMEAIWQKLAEHPKIGPEKVAKIRGMIDTMQGIWTFIKDVQERGVAAIWEYIQEQLSNLWQIVLDAIMNWIMERIITEVSVKLLTMLDPTGVMAVINSAIAIYKAVQSFIRYLREMLEVINAFVHGIVDIAQGNIQTAADYLESTMDKAMPIVIGFLANQVGLGGLGKRVAEMIGSARDMVDKALTWLVNKAVDTGMAFLDTAVTMGRTAVQKIKEWWKIKKVVKSESGKTRTIYFSGEKSNAKLFIKSSPGVSYTAFLASVESNMITDKQKKAHDDAKILGVKIEKNIKSHKMTEEEGAEIVEDLNTMADLVKVMDVQIELPPSRIRYGSLVNGGGGTVAEAEVLSYNSGGSVGTEPADNPPIYQAVTNRKNDNNAKAYVQGHLLNHNVHGPGKRFNMTPITYTANDRHKRGIEKEVKERVLGTGDYGDKQVIYYKVEAVYGTHEASSDYTTLKDNNSRNNLEQTQFEMMEADRKLCTEFKFQAHQLEPNGEGSFKKGEDFGSKYQAVKNEIPKKAPFAVTVYKSLTELSAEANTRVGANMSADWNSFYNDTANKVSIDNLSNTDKDALRNIFSKANAIQDERNRISRLNDMQTWNAFMGNRTAYTGNLLENNEKLDLFNRFNQRMRSLKTTFLNTMKNYVNNNLTDGNTQWGSFRNAQGFVARSYSYLGSNFTILSDDDIRTFRTNVFEPRIAALNAASDETEE